MVQESKESTKEVLKVFSVLKYRLGSIHLKVGEGICGASYENDGLHQRAWLKNWRLIALGVLVQK